MKASLLRSLYGDLSSVSGDLTGVYGDLSSVSGDLTGVYGDLTGVYGDLTGVSGDLTECDITDSDRTAGIDITVLILPPLVVRGVA